MTFDSTILVYLLGIPAHIASFVWVFPRAFPRVIEPTLTLLMKWTFYANFIGGTAMVAIYNLAFRAYIDPKKLQDADNKLLELQLYFFVALTFPYWYSFSISD